MNKVVHRNKAVYGDTTTIILADGYAFVMVSVVEDNLDVAIIHDLVVHKDRRSEGLGGQLLKEACKEAKEMGVKAVKLSVLADSWLEEWYKRHGFIEMSRGPIFTESAIHVTLMKYLESE